MDTITLPVSAPLQPAPGVDDAIAPYRPPQAADVDRFNALMNSPAGGSATQPANATAAAQEPRNDPPRTLGDHIVNGLQGASGELQHSWRAMREALSGSEPMTMQQMMQFQMGLSEASLTYDLVSKCVSRSTQNLDQLVKLQ